MKKLYSISVISGAANIVVTVAALAMNISLPYRIRFTDYSRYKWAEYLIEFSIGLALLTFICGAVARQGWLPLRLSLLGLFPLLFIGGVHSGPNPQAWCFSNLRQIDGAKEQLARERGLTNGTPVSIADISKFMAAGQEFRCAEHGRYIVNSIGNDARCTFHGSIPEIEAKWQKQMLVHLSDPANGSRTIRAETNQTSAAGTRGGTGRR